MSEKSLNKVLGVLVMLLGLSAFVFGYGGCQESKRLSAMLDNCWELIDNSHRFCKDCCWRNEHGNRVIFTCAPTKEQLWRKIP
jgi:hypothetical protein